MEARKLGAHGLEVSAQGLGCMGMSEFYGTTNDAEAAATIHRALELGITLFDTADMYGPFTIERLLGRALAGHRDQVVIATKFGNQRNDDGSWIGINGRAEYVSCFGSGTVRDDIAQKSGNKFAVESCHIKIKDSDVSAHIWRFLYDVARQYRESFDVYGTKKSFEWTLVEGEPHVIHTAKKPEHEIPSKVEVPDFAHLLPEPIRKFTQSIQDADHLSFIQGGGHGGSHPHLVNEMVSALIGNRDPWPNASLSANWTCVGILAHESALKGGAVIHLPEFTLS